MSASGRSLTLSPVVVIVTTSTAFSRPNSAWTAARRAHTSPACASASLDPRVPIRTSGVLGFIAGCRRHHRSRPGLVQVPAHHSMKAPMRDRKQPPVVLGIETSCDETAAAVVDGARTIHSNVVRSQVREHREYGGVVPEIAARSHIEYLDDMIRKAMDEADVGFPDLDAVAATGGPGLIGGVLVGSTMAKTIALARDIPFIAVNHLEGHALTARLTDGLRFPYLLLLVSGGHCQLLGVLGVGEYRQYGSTVDDAVGEAFDKTAKLLGLGYPGGPALEAAARDGDPRRIPLAEPDGRTARMLVLVLRPEDRGPPPGCGDGTARCGRPGRSCRGIPGCGDAIAGGSQRQCDPQLPHQPW